ncbi:hypothetical protein CERSUDRAFT_81908 [Gelatoporia subvermispora B]|uniref:DUF202 domain-containing protein n=1 Tax=Ceriporiopsis subvermispora (strain B) TaxID=914234 RepID=M2RK04_CERS8|nr:hypothetical protein CERSUDRAFT_81908 [Gelatoporia subvermispora B]
MPAELENTGSAARDFAMLERNLLSHVRLAILLSLLASSLLLHARLPDPSSPSSGDTPNVIGNIPVAAIAVITALAAIGAGLWEYWRGYKDMREMRGFLVATKSHFLIMSLVALVVFATCLTMITDKSL